MARYGTKSKTKKKKHGNSISPHIEAMYSTLQNSNQSFKDGESRVNKFQVGMKVTGNSRQQN